MDWKKYVRANLAEMTPWEEGMDMAGISVSDVDAANGSPRQGDMIARNPRNHLDKWLVAQDYFQDNFREFVEVAPSA